jgi:hypothetical protein
MSPVFALSTGWEIGFVLGIIVVIVVATIVAVIVVLALAIAKQAQAAVDGVEQVRAQTELAQISRVNDSGVRILHSARALRKVAVGR